MGDTDGNPNTEGVADWTPLQWTYPMPDHDSGHAIQGGVAAEILKQVFGTDALAFTTRRLVLILVDAVSRIYIGIHFRRAVEEGVDHGRKIAQYAFHQFLKPVR